MDAGKTGANLCTSCGACKKHCPQSIDIPIVLKSAHKDLNKKFMYFALSIYAKISRRKRRKNKISKS